MTRLDFSTPPPHRFTTPCRIDNNQSYNDITATIIDLICYFTCFCRIDKKSIGFPWFPQSPSMPMARAGWVLRTLLLSDQNAVLRDRKTAGGRSVVRRCASGSELIDWLMNLVSTDHDSFSRHDVIGMWQALLEEGVISHGEWFSLFSFLFYNSFFAILNFTKTIIKWVCVGARRKKETMYKQMRIPEETRKFNGILCPSCRIFY